MERDGEDQSRRQREELDRLRKDETPARREQGERSSFLQDNIRRTEFRATNVETGGGLESRWPQDGPKNPKPLSRRQEKESQKQLEVIHGLLEPQRASRRDPDERLTFFRTSVRDSEFRPKDSDAVGASPPGERPKDLEERFQRDLAIFKGFEGFKPDVWDNAKMHEQVAVLKEAERQLAADQGRPGYRVFALRNEHIKKHLKKHHDNPGALTLGLVQPPRGEWIEATQLKGKDHEQLKEMILDRKERVIYINDVVFYLPVKDSVRILAEESFHAYQREVLDRPNAHPEVNESVREFWKKGRDNFRSYSYEDQPMELHAKAYAARLQKELMGQYFPIPDLKSEWPPQGS